MSQSATQGDDEIASIASRPESFERLRLIYLDVWVSAARVSGQFRAPGSADHCERKAEVIGLSNRNKGKSNNRGDLCRTR